MASPLLLLLVFVLSLIALVKASDFFTDAAEKIGLTLGLPPFIVGVTIVSMGTSLPELLSSLFSIFQGAPEVVVSNVVGSNIANICLVIGTAAIISARCLRISYDLVSVDLPLFMGSALLFTLMAWDQSFSRGEALLLFIGYIMYLFYILKGSDEASGESLTPSDSDGNESAQPSVDSFRATQLSRQGLILLLSGIFIFLGAKYTIESLIQLSEVLNIGKEVIAVSAVALGTSLPELIVTISAASKGKAEIAIGNVLGSNIFNVFVVIGIPGLIQALPVPEAVIIPGLPTLVAASLMTFFIAQDKKVTIWEGWMFILFYVWFVGSVFELF
ncbi:MAG: calcium/sodium antiporter [Cyanobacteria bacterium P01_F01_bin.3]